MKWMIASDIHGSAYYCNKLLRLFESEQAQRLLLLGDILYHGPRNPLPKEYVPAEVAAMLNERRNQIICIRGNCDSEVDQLVLRFPLCENCVLSIGDRLIFATHGHRFDVSNPPPLSKGDILLHGHTHAPAYTSFGADNRYINPGSVSLPKDDSLHGCILLDGRALSFVSLDGAVWQTYRL